ncbi:MAG: tRNA uridine-5-carboxymethylaminomethyl(34) synthesis GTPase MnmE [Gammaproteobacteria bacterium]|nr:tRNA uridine-5-carboxymethylaminomethyl(34) synthesis GTPase MnmE [Gammaproteobacteria bacterium]
MHEHQDQPESEPIAAIATPPGNGGVGVLRISGDSIDHITQSILGCVPIPRQATLLPFLDHHGNEMDRGLAILFPAPNSYTGETVLELQGHGGSVLMNLLLKRVIDLGARIAEAGEFTQRAFINGKLDLAQAEAVADLIECSSEQAVRCAQRSLSGQFSNTIHGLVERLIELRCHIESAIDFSDEDLDLISGLSVRERMSSLQTDIEQILNSAQQGVVLRNGITIVIAGSPNTGKSTLLNRMAGDDVAIISDIPGTTRDLLKQQIHIDGLPVHIIDTAGLRETDDPIELEGIHRAKLSISQADYILQVIDSSQTQATECLDEFNSVPVIKIFNKIDISGIEPTRTDYEHGVGIYLSAKTGSGMELLFDYLKSSVGYQSNEDVFMARARHVNALEQARDFIQSAFRHFSDDLVIELLAEDLRLVQNALSQITGEFVADDLLGEIFSKFCIGK